MAALFDAAEERFGGVDVVVNAAGRMTLAPSRRSTSTTSTACTGTTSAARSSSPSRPPGGCAPAVRSSTSPPRSRGSLADLRAYAATKGAVEAISPILASELRGRTSPSTPSPRADRDALFLDGKDEETDRAARRGEPLERLGAPEDIAEAVAFLAGPARWVNGQALYVNGGVA